MAETENTKKNVRSSSIQNIIDQLGGEYSIIPCIKIKTTEQINDIILKINNSG